MKITILLLIISISLHAQTLTGKIVKVSDGDTFTLLVEKEQIKVRLWGIDCPEKKQDYGNKATEKLRDLTKGRDIKVLVKGMDRYKRVLGIVYTNDTNINEELLRCGLAWRYKHTKSKHYQSLQDEAKSNKINIWSVQNPIAPWNFRNKI